MRDECFDRYPRLKEEILSFSRAGNEGGVVAFLLDTLIDVENLGFKELSNKRQTSDDGLGAGDDPEKVRVSVVGQGGYPIL